VTYTDLPVEEYQRVLVQAGLPEPLAAVFVDGDRGWRRASCSWRATTWPG
jgi:hypothetical protein